MRGIRRVHEQIEIDVGFRGISAQLLAIAAALANLGDREDNSYNHNG
ncbi:MAG TPA: hypothetical protein VE263_14295 [Candidatus Angelobacter sp.]|nr:hypothetical protein [Candidatus Angelobacter sp.]